MITAKDAFFIICSYSVGCCTTGYYWTRWRSGTDIRQHGSGSVGASNVGRTLGVSGFVVTFLLDIAKGAVVVWAARFSHAVPLAVVACMVAVVAGHIWPIQLRFQGGKGIATSLGALCFYNYTIALILLCPFAPFYLLSRRFVLSGMVAYALAPLCALIVGLRHADVAAITLLSLLVIFAHRRNIREDFALLMRPRTTPIDVTYAAGKETES